MNRAQISMEYTILMGFMLFSIICSVVLAFYYSSIIRENLRAKSVENFGKKIITNAESVYYFGYPSKTTIESYVPDGIKEIKIENKSLIITTKYSSGIQKREFVSRVPLNGSIRTTSGLRKITIEAFDDYSKITG